MQVISAKEVAGPKLREGVVVGKVDRRIDADVRRGLGAFFIALVGLQRHQLAAHLREEAFVAVFGGDMRTRSAKEDIDVAFEYVKSRRAVVALADDDFTGGVVAADHGMGVEFKKGSRDALEDWKGEEVFCLDRVA